MEKHFDFSDKLFILCRKYKFKQWYKFYKSSILMKMSIHILHENNNYQILHRYIRQYYPNWWQVCYQILMGIYPDRVTYCFLPENYYILLKKVTYCSLFNNWTHTWLVWTRKYQNSLILLMTIIWKRPKSNFEYLICSRKNWN